MQEENKWLTSFVTRNNVWVKVRLLGIEDAPHLTDIFDHMGEESRYQRFNQTVENLSSKRIWEEALQIVQATTFTGKGLIAFVDLPNEPHVPVAVARYVHISADTAEVAMSVRDDFHGQGVGGTLFNLLLEEAKRSGLRTLVGMLQNNNMGMWIVFDRIPYKVIRSLDGYVSEIEIDLTQLKHSK